MKIIPSVLEKNAGTVYTLIPEGRLDAVTVPALESVLQAELETQHTQLVIDLGQVAYLSSSGLRALLRFRRQAQQQGGDLVLANMNSRVQEIFEMIGFTNLFRVFDGTAAAVKSFEHLPAKSG